MDDSKMKIYTSNWLLVSFLSGKEALNRLSMSTYHLWVWTWFRNRLKKGDACNSLLSSTAFLYRIYKTEGTGFLLTGWIWHFALS